jgi:septum formation protein
MDKAGAYAIQDEDVPTVARLDGCYCAVMGLPLYALKRKLELLDVPCADPAATRSVCRTCPMAPRGDGP